MSRDRQASKAKPRCATRQPVVGTASQHYCRQPKGHEPHWHRCTCGHVWRPES